MSLVAINWKPDRRQLSQFGLISVVVFAALGVWSYFGHKLLGIPLSDRVSQEAAVVLWAFAVGCGLFALFAPALLRPLYVGLSVVGLPIGYAISFVVMFIIFFVVILPTGLVFRLLGRDSLHRNFDRAAASYWIRREPVTDVKRYYRQF